MPDTAVSSYGGKNILVFGEMDVIDFFVVGDQLGIDRPFLNVPDGASSVDGACPNEVYFFGVPIERGQRCTEFVILNYVKSTFLRSSLRRTVWLSRISQTLRFSPEVARRSDPEPDSSGLKRILVGG